MNYCKTVDPRDYDLCCETAKVSEIMYKLGTSQRPLDNPHRIWEYGMVLRALLEHDVKDVLDVGGGGSLFAPAAAWFDMRVTVVDPLDFALVTQAQAELLGGKQLSYDQRDFMDYQGEREFDAVTSISVLEHIEDDVAFFKKLASYVKLGGILGLTVDFWPDGTTKVNGHLRTYNKKRLEKLIRSVKKEFTTLGSPDYDRPQDNVCPDGVHSYTFASLVLKRLG